MQKETIDKLRELRAKASQDAIMFKRIWEAETKSLTVCELAIRARDEANNHANTLTLLIGAMEMEAINKMETV